jgi:hypothetical protein
VARRIPDLALGLALAASAAASALLVPWAAARLGLDAAAPDIQLGVFLGLWGPAVVAVCIAWVRSGGVVAGVPVPRDRSPLVRTLPAYFASLLLFELVAASALISSWATLAVLGAFAASGWWLTGRLAFRSAGRTVRLRDLLEERRDDPE